MAIVLMGWAFFRFHDYRCLVPWQGGPSNEPAMFILASMAVMAGFVWPTAETFWFGRPSCGVGWDPGILAVTGIVIGLALYGFAAAVTHALDPSDRYYGQGYYRDRLSLSWVAGLLEETKHYDVLERWY